ncbi:MAG TPA: hypothetical protein PK413_21115, partial [Thermoanaerobaculia bacterium]|nr:hypothetical protein [Thermoanaerobaculia bacterium]
SQTPQWLRELGLPAPRESEVEIHVGYSSRIYRFQPEPRPWQSLFVVPRPPDTRAAAVFPIGPDRWVVTLAGWLADYPPVDPDGYLGFARSLPVPEVAAALEGASPLTSAVPHRFPSSRRRHYERLRPAPEGLVVMGDALCSFNPVYGQGMTLATLHAQALEESLGRAGTTPADLCRRYHRLAAKASDVPWQLATGEDFRYAKAKGRRPFGTRWVNAYVGRVHLAASSDPAVAQAFFRVLHLLSPPALLFRPDIPFRLLRHALRGSAERE